MRYSDNRIIKTGDLVCLRGRQLGVIGCVIDNDDYTDEFPKSDYAYLERTDLKEDELLIVARALLPEAIDEGTKLKYEMLQYEML